MEERSRLNFKFDQLLKLLCSEIYDSPLSMLRENVQNAYDAILMRKQSDPSMGEGEIKIKIENKRVIISDNGTGMSKEGLKLNYWTAGSSGKNNETAKAAGVVGTFGIGAMANFGVCDRLTVITRQLESDITYISSVDRKDLADNGECIHTSTDTDPLLTPGTIVIVDLLDTNQITPEEAEQYLIPYIQYIPFPVYLNDKNLSQKSYRLTAQDANDLIINGSDRTADGITFDYKILLNKNNYINPRVELSEIKYDFTTTSLGNVILKTTDETIFGFRNSFGLAQVPVGSAFGFGGIADLKNLIPTAGRDAISRESANFIASLVSTADRLVAEAIAGSEMADKSRELIQYIRTHNRYDLAENIEIRVANSDDRIALGMIKPEMDGKKVMYYPGIEKNLMNGYVDQDNIVLMPSNDRNRRILQLTILRQKGIEEIKDTPEVLRTIGEEEISIEEMSILYRIKTVVEDDYLIPDCEVKFAEISHGLSMFVTLTGEKVSIFLKWNSADLNTLKDIYVKSYGLFEPFVKDFVRTRLYPKLAPYIPSSQKDGADALYSMLMRKKELYTIDADELGSMDHIIKEYLKGRIDMNALFIAADREKNRTTQVLNSNNIGNAHEIIGINVLSPVKGQIEENVEVYEPLPPILRRESETKFKILKTDHDTSIEGYFSFLAIWDKMDRDYRDFFLQPHTTRIIWSMHKIIYIFTHASGSLTLYYEMELQKKLANNVTGGRLIRTATIITKNRIFIPVIDELRGYFDITKGKLKFMVRYDSIKS